MGRAVNALLGAGLLGLAGWIAYRNLSLSTQDGWIFWVPMTALLVTMAALCWWSVIAGEEPASRENIRASWVMGLTIGAAGLILGVVGPLLVGPGANLGPLLGILLAGPLGFVAGAVGAALFRSTS